MRPHPALADLKKAKAESDRRNYKAKHQIISRLLDQRPGEFVQDSTGQGMIGLTHKPTGFKIHAPIQVVRGRATPQPLYHGSPSKFKSLRANSWLTPYLEDARSFGVPWSSDDLEDTGGKGGRPPTDLRFKPGRAPSDSPLHVYQVDGETRHAKTNTGRDYDWNRQLIKKAPAKLLESYPSWRGVFNKTAAQVFTYVPAAMKDQILREGLYSSKALLKRHDLLDATAATRGDDPDKWRSDIRERLKSWKPEAVQGPNVLFHEPDAAMLPADHPMKKWQLSRLNVDLEELLRRRPTTRVHGLELTPYDKAKGDDPDYPQQRHHDLTPQEIEEIAARPAADVWSQYSGAGRGMYAADVPHASIITRGGVIPPRYLKEAAVTKLADLLPWVHLQPQQERVKKRVGEGQNLLVYHGLGSGKSLAGIAAAEGVGGPYTAVVPASLRPNYEGEIGKFSDQKTPSEVLSYTGIGMGLQPKQDPDTVIMDEVQRLRNPDSEASQAAMNLAARAKHKVLLSGTPIVNAPSDLAVPLSILTGKNMSPAGFNKKFVGTKTVDPGLMGWFKGIHPAEVPTIKDEQGLERLLENHVDYQASRAPEGVKTRDERVEVDLSPEQQDFYKLMWGKLPWVTRWKLSNDYPLTGQELAHLSSFMTGPRQAALSLFPFHSSKDPMYAFKTSSKLQSAMGSLKQTLAKDPRAKALVYSNFIDAGLTPYGAALQAEGIPFGQFHGTMTEEDRKKALADYNEGRSRVLLLGPAAAEGISARGTQLIQLLDPHWNEARLGQARGRGLRFDSHEGLPPELRNVRIQRFVAKMPAPGWLGRLFGAEARPSADEVLEQQSRRKEELNEQFREVLRRVGSPGYQRPWGMFG